MKGEFQHPQPTSFDFIKNSFCKKGQFLLNFSFCRSLTIEIFLNFFLEATRCCFHQEEERKGTKMFRKPNFKNFAFNSSLFSS